MRGTKCEKGFVRRRRCNRGVETSSCIALNRLAKLQRSLSLQRAQLDFSAIRSTVVRLSDSSPAAGFFESGWRSAGELMAGKERADVTHSHVDAPRASCRKISDQTRIESVSNVVGNFPWDRARSSSWISIQAAMSPKRENNET
jgi:hypothetical protein